jgi:hypothetical protein
MKRDMAGRECYHCKQWIEEGEAHDCWTTTEAALTKDLSEDLQDAYARLREAAVDLGEQRIYASHHSIMFSRKACHFLVKPRRKHLEFWMFLGRAIKAPQIRKVVESSKVKRAHLIHIHHRDEVEPPLTDWMREAYELQDQVLKQPGQSAFARPKPSRAPARRPRAAAATRKRPKKR